MSNQDIKQAFELSAMFLAHKTYQSLTHALIHYFSMMDGVSQVASYEVFSEQSNVDHRLSIRRFPLTLDENWLFSSWRGRLNAIKLTAYLYPARSIEMRWNRFLVSKMP